MMPTASQAQAHFVAGQTTVPSSAAVPPQLATAPERFPLRRDVDPSQLEGFHRDENGAYRWECRVSTLSNPTVLINLMWTVGIIAALFLAIALIGWIADGCDDDILGIFAFAVIGSVAVMLLFSVAWLILMRIKGPEAIAGYAMEENKISYITNSVRSGKRGIDHNEGGDALFADGGEAPKTYDSFSFDYAQVKKVKAVRPKNLIWVEVWMQKGTIFVPDGYFDFVYDHIVSRCPKAKIM